MPTKHTPKVLHICKIFLPEKGGVQAIVDNIAQSLRGYAHSIITTSMDGCAKNEKINQAEVLRCRSYGQLASMPIAPSLLFYTIKQARRCQLIALHYPFPLAELALLFIPFSPPIIVHWHSNIVAQKRLKWLVFPLSLFTLFRAKAIVVTSKHMSENSMLLRYFRKKTVYIPYGLPPVVSRAINKKRSADEKYFVLVGRHVAYKGIDIAISALRLNRFHLKVIGSGALLEENRELADNLGVACQMEFIDSASDEEISEILFGSVALVVPSITENEAFALVQLEAMRLGKPVINTNLKSSVPWVARHGKEALTIAAGDYRALSEAMELLITNDTLREKLGSNGKQRYQKCFNNKRFGNAVEDLYSRSMKVQSNKM